MTIKLKNLVSRLSQQDLLYSVGEKKFKKLSGPNYLGSVDVDGESIINTIREYGISLILHTDAHNEASMPTNRIFESIAAGAVVITDRNPFIVKTFKDNVLYIDREKSEEEIYQEIINHFNWIKQNPIKVKQMSENAFKIMEENYLIETNLLKLLGAHKKFKQQNFKGEHFW